MSATAKPVLREQLLVARARLAPVERATKSTAVCQHLAGLEPFARARTVASYAPLGAEVDVAPALRAAAAAGCRVVYPRVVPGVRQLAFAACSPEALVAGPFRALQPPPEAPAVAAEEIDCIVVPGVAFDRAGRRLGRGGGYYDAAIAALPAETYRVGVAFDLQLVESVPAEEHDAHVDAIVTESGVHRASPPRPHAHSR